MTKLRIAPITEYGSFDEYLVMTGELYAECEEEFKASDVQSDEFPEICEKWAAAARTLIQAACALFGRTPANQENKKHALAIFECCKADSGARAKSLRLHYLLARQDEKITPKDLKKKFDQWNEGLRFVFRAEATQMSYLKRYLSDPNYVNRETQIEQEQAPLAERYRKRVPAGHMFLPARPYPPVRTPDWQREVPEPPAPFCRWKQLPPEDFIYDEEHDEFILPEGYLSEDGTIDDKSVVFNWEEDTVTCKFVGGEPVTWPMWKPKHAGDHMYEGSWPWDYYRTLYRQTISGAPPGESP